MGSREQVRAVIGRRLREHYEAAASQTIPDRLAKLLEEMEQSESRSQRVQDERKDVPVDASRTDETVDGGKPATNEPHRRAAGRGTSRK
jgi:hypothetical protein